MAFEFKFTTGNIYEYFPVEISDRAWEAYLFWSGVYAKAVMVVGLANIFFWEYFGSFICFVQKAQVIYSNTDSEAHIEIIFGSSIIVKAANNRRFLFQNIPKL